MAVISSTSTPFYRQTVPKVIYGGLGFLSALAALGAAIQHDPWLLGFPVVAMGSAIAAIRMRLRPLLDHVRDMGDHLLVRRDGVEDRIALSAIRRVENVARASFIRLTLASPGAFGREVTFVPIDRPSGRIAANLEERVARSGGQTGA